MARKRKRAQRVRLIFKLTHLDGLGVKYILANSFVGACLLAYWESARVKYEIVDPTDKGYQASRHQPTLPGT